MTYGQSLWAEIKLLTHRLDKAKARYAASKSDNDYRHMVYTGRELRAAKDNYHAACMARSE